MKYIFLDIDGTLFDHNTLCIPESTKKAVELAGKRGNKIFISTGRTCCMLDLVDEIGFEGVIAAAGAYVKVGEEVIYEESIEKEKLKEVVNFCDEHDVAYILEGRSGVYLDSKVTGFFNRMGGMDDSLKAFFSHKMFRGMNEYLEEEEIIYKMSLYALHEEDLFKVKERFSKGFHMVSGQTDERYPYSAELLLLKNNKANGIRKAIEYSGADMADTVAIGDSLNDLEMIKECTVGIAMGNADERLKPHADFVTADIGKHGIYKAFERFQLI